MKIVVPLVTWFNAVKVGSGTGSIPAWPVARTVP